MSRTVEGTQPDYDDGQTPVTSDGRAGFARYAARAVQEFPNAHSLEVGNEFNTSGFTHRPGWEGDIWEGTRTYAALLKDTVQAMRAARHDVRMLGGAAHSIPRRWFQQNFAAGGADYMDAMLPHPYASPPKILRRQIALLRRIPGAEAMPVEITEWGLPDAVRAPVCLMKGYCQFTLSGVTRFIWYPLGDRGDRGDRGRAGLPTGVRAIPGAASAGPWGARLARRLE